MGLVFDVHRLGRNVAITDRLSNCLSSSIDEAAVERRLRYLSTKRLVRTVVLRPAKKGNCGLQA